MSVCNIVAQSGYFLEKQKNEQKFFTNCLLNFNIRLFQVKICSNAENICDFNQVRRRDRLNKVLAMCWVVKSKNMPFYHISKRCNMSFCHIAKWCEMA